MRAKWIVQVELHKAQARLATAANDAEVKAAQAEVGKLLDELASVTEAEHDGDQHAGGESPERAALLNQVSIAHYVQAARDGQPVQGAAAELLASYGMAMTGVEGGTRIPWSVISQGLRVPSAAYTTTSTNDGGVDQRPYIGRIFAMSLADFLGCRMESVTGVGKFPVLTGGTSVAAKAEGTAAAPAVAATVNENELLPLKVTGRFELTHELNASSPEADAGLAMDLIGDVRNAMNQLVLTGNGAAPQPQGILGATENPSNSSVDLTFADVIGIAAGAVDGRHVAEETQVGVLMNAAAYRKASELVTTVGDYSALDRLRMRCRGVRASSLMPATSGNNARVLLHRGMAGGMRSDCLMVLFGGGPELIRDRFSQSSQGVVMTVIGLWNFAPLRASSTVADSAYVERRWKVS